MRSPEDSELILYRPLPPSRKGLKKLTAKNMRVISLHLQGYSHKEIAFALRFKTTAAISCVLRDPLARKMIDVAIEDYDMELRAMAPMVMNSMRSALTSGDPRAEAAARTEWFRTQGKFKETSMQERTAEDVVEEILKIRVKGEAEVTLARREIHATIDS